MRDARPKHESSRIKLLFIMDRAAAPRSGTNGISPRSLRSSGGGLHARRTVRYFGYRQGRPPSRRQKRRPSGILLVDRWPDKDRGPEYRSALQACMDVMEGRRAAASARRAFIRAAKEASLFVREGKARHH